MCVCVYPTLTRDSGMLPCRGSIGRKSEGAGISTHTPIPFERAIPAYPQPAYCARVVAGRYYKGQQIRTTLTARPTTAPTAQEPGEWVLICFPL